MPGKSRHHRGKHSLPSKKKRSQRSPQVIATQQKAAVQFAKPAASPPKVTSPLAGISAPATTTVKNPELSLEIRRIGILAGAILAALILLALFLD